MAEPQGQHWLLLLLFQNSARQVTEEQVSCVHNESKHSDRILTPRSEIPPCCILEIIILLFQKKRE